VASGIYEIKNLTNDKRYVGSAVDLRRRERDHKRALLKGAHTNRYLQNSWNKYGEGAFEFDVIEYWEPEFLVGMEQWWMNMLRPEYNMCMVAGSRLGCKHTDEAKAKMMGNTNCVGYKQTNEHKAKASAANMGYIATAETRAKISKALMGNTNCLGHKQTDEAKANTSAALKGKKRGPYQRLMLGGKSK